MKIRGHIKHYRPSESFVLDVPDKYYKEIFEYNMRLTDVIIDDILED